MIIFSITLKTEQELSQIFAINLCKNSSGGKKKKREFIRKDGIIFLIQGATQAKKLSKT